MLGTAKGSPGTWHAKPQKWRVRQRANKSRGKGKAPHPRLAQRGDALLRRVNFQPTSHAKSFPCCFCSQPCHLCVSPFLIQVRSKQGNQTLSQGSIFCALEMLHPRAFPCTITLAGCWEVPGASAAPHLHVKHRLVRGLSIKAKAAWGLVWRHGAAGIPSMHPLKLMDAP